MSSRISAEEVPFGFDQSGPCYALTKGEQTAITLFVYIPGGLVLFGDVFFFVQWVIKSFF